MRRNYQIRVVAFDKGKPVASDLVVRSFEGRKPNILERIIRWIRYILWLIFS